MKVFCVDIENYLKISSGGYGNGFGRTKKAGFTLGVSLDLKTCWSKPADCVDFPSPLQQLTIKPERVSRICAARIKPGVEGFSIVQ